MIIIVMAWRNIWRHRIRSLIIMVSVSLGLVAGVFVLALYKGMLNDRLNTVINTEVSHIQIHHPEFKEDYDPVFFVTQQPELTVFLKQSDFVEHFSERVVTQGMLATGTGSAGAQITGIDPETEDAVSQINKKIIEGEPLTGKKNQILIGKKLAEKLEMKLRSKVILTFTDVDKNIISAAFRVSGIYQTDNAPRDERFVYVHRSDLGRLLGTENSFHELAIILRDGFEEENIKTRLESKFPDHSIQTWKEISPETRLMIETTDQYSYIFIGIIMLALSFGIINTMLMAVLERSQEIGMLTALGMNRIRLFFLILSETILLAITGVPLGFFIAWILIIYFKSNGINISTFAGEAMAEFGFGTMVYPEFPWESLITIMMIVTVAAMVSSLFPSVKAIRLNPIDAMRK